ncbi:MAG: glycoside hydrolase family 2, partial [Pseudopedobacter saltans]
MQKLIKYITLVVVLLFCVGKINAQNDKQQSFNDGWLFYEYDSTKENVDTINFKNWNLVQLPHDWSIYHDFSKSYATTPNQGALPGGIGWYAKKFRLPKSYDNKFVYIDFDGIYRNSEVWINGHYLGKRPNGYISFRYDLSPYLKRDGSNNKILVKVDNSKQPESRWYTGAGIYRNVWLTTNNAVQIKQWGTFVEPKIEQSNNALMGSVTTSTSIENKLSKRGTYLVKNIVYNNRRVEVASRQTTFSLKDKENLAKTTIELNNPELWSPENPNLYRMQTYVL